MSVRRRIVRERLERESRQRLQAAEFTMSLQQIQDAITAARARGETTCTERFLREAFTVQPAPETPVTPELKCPKCLVDRTKEPCPEITSLDCPISGTASNR